MVFNVNDMPQTQLGTRALCNETREIVAARLLLGSCNITFVFVYLRQEKSEEEDLRPAESRR